LETLVSAEPLQRHPLRSVALERYPLLTQATTSLQQRLKTGGRLVKNALYYWLCRPMGFVV